jgi:hypothetical protein
VIRALRRLWLHWSIAGTEAYLRACERDGLGASLNTDGFRAQLDAWRVQLCLLEPKE